MTTDVWVDARVALLDTAGRFVDLLDTVENPRAPAVGHWAISQVAAHVREVTLLNTLFALGQPPPDEWREVFDIATTTTMAGVAALNARSLEIIGEPSLRELAALIKRQVDDLLTGTEDAAGGETIAWLGGTKVPIVAVLAHTLSELFVHGTDIARAEGRTFALPPSAAAAIFEGFLFELIRSPDLARFVGARAEAVEPVTCELRLRGAGRMLLVVDDDGVSIAPSGSRRVDVRVSADPATMWLVMSGRSSPLAPIVSGRLAVWGRRPWRLRRLDRALQTP